MKYIIAIDDSILDLKRIDKYLNDNFSEYEVLGFESIYQFNSYMRKNKIAKDVSLIVSDIFMLNSYKDVKGLAKQLSSKDVNRNSPLLRLTKHPFTSSLNGTPIIAYSKFVNRFENVTNNNKSQESHLVNNTRIKTIQYLHDMNIPLVSKYDNYSNNEEVQSSLHALGKEIKMKLKSLEQRK